MVDFSAARVDEGYEVPAFGILIDEKLSRFGLEMCVETAKVICIWDEARPDDVECTRQLHAGRCGRTIGCRGAVVFGAKKTGNSIPPLELDGGVRGAK